MTRSWLNENDNWIAYSVKTLLILCAASRYAAVRGVWVGKRRTYPDDLQHDDPDWADALGNEQQKPDQTKVNLQGATENSSRLRAIELLNASVDCHGRRQMQQNAEYLNLFGLAGQPNTEPVQRRPTRLTGPPRFIGVPARTPIPGAPTPGRTTARATGRGRRTTPGRTMHPTGYSMYWQYTTAPAFSVLAATKPATNPLVSKIASALDRFIVASSSFLSMTKLAQ
ncbi:hypothetical protein BBta_0601 [Bradyrhizobium sp. BTAi1]|nr:hypothetical protein BBta_0601 [Bradyrhizobium sp. BTAi1]